MTERYLAKMSLRFATAAYGQNSVKWCITFKNTSDRPTLIIVDSHIAYGSPNKQDTSSAHGSPLGAEEIKLTKRNYGWPEDSSFLVPEGVKEHFNEVNMNWTT